jgi:hypothetical protein
MRSFFRVLPLALVLVCTLSLPASEASNDLVVIQAALDHHFANTLPYVDRWVIAEKTEPLQAVDLGLPNATCRAGDPLDIATIQLRDGVEVSSLEKFSAEGTFDWNAFEQAFDGGTWTARVARPCFVDEANAVVRVDVSAKGKPRSLTSAIMVTKGTDGLWSVRASRSR